MLKPKYFSGVSGPASVLAFLRAYLRKAAPCKLLKMLVIGPPRQGKTSLLEALQTGEAAPITPAECSISISTWELDNPNGDKSSVRKHTVHTFRQSLHTFQNTTIQIKLYISCPKSFVSI